jgi:hypothetical protein
MTTANVRPVREDDPKPSRVSVEASALSLPKRVWRTCHVAGRHQQEAAVALCPRACCPDTGRNKRSHLSNSPKFGIARGRGHARQHWLATIDANISLRELVDRATISAHRARTMAVTSRRKLVSDIMRAAAGRAPIIMVRFPSQPTAFRISERERITPIIRRPRG